MKFRLCRVSLKDLVIDALDAAAACHFTLSPSALSAMGYLGFNQDTRHVYLIT
jgi:hypothetical protein